MDYKFLLGSLGIAAALLSYGIYIKDILRGKTHPHAFSWFVWGLPCGIVFVAQLLAGAGLGSWVTAVTMIMCTAIFIMSLFYGETKITKLDWISLLSALFALILWGLVKDPLGSVILITISDVIGFVPTIRKSINKPYEEPLISYFIGGLKWGFSLMAMSAFSFTIVLYPMAMIVANWSAVVLFLVRRRTLAIKVE